MNPFEEDDEEASDFDPEDPIPDEASDSVSIDVPAVSEPPTFDVGEDLEAKMGDVDDETLSAFVICVVLTNVTVFGVSLGAMLIAFRGSWRWGGLALGIGLVSGIRAYQVYRDWKQYRNESADESDGDTSGDAESTAETSDDVETPDDTRGSEDPPGGGGPLREDPTRDGSPAQNDPIRDDA